MVDQGAHERESVLDQALGPVRPDRDGWALAASLEGVPSALSAARDTADLVLRDRGLRRVTPRETAESLLRGAVSASWLSGGESDDEAARAGMGDEVTGRALRVYGEAVGLAPGLGRSALGAFARLHALAAAGIVPAEMLGRPRDAAGAAALVSLGSRLAAPTTASALVVASLAYAEIVASAPFGLVDQLIACAVERTILVGRGFDPASVLVPEAGHWRLRDAEASALEAVRGGTSRGVRDWLLHAGSVIAVGVSESPLTCERRPHRGDAVR